MALKLIEGFDHFDMNVSAALKGWTKGTSGSGSNTVSSVAGRINGFALSMHYDVANLLFYSKLLPGTYTTAIMGFAFHPSTLGFSADAAIAGFYGADATTAIAFVYMSPAGKIKIKNSGGTTIATSTATLVAGAWNYIEVKIVVNGASGSVTTQFNGAADIGTTTGNFGSTAIGVLNLYLNADAAQPLGTLLFDDVYVVDTTSPNSTFLGDIHVETLYPTSDGAHTDWTPNSGVTHYNRVNQTTPDDDTTYNSDATVNHIDSYGYSDLTPVSGTIFGVQTNLWARKDDATLRQLKALIRSAGTDYTPGSTQTMSTTYSDYTDIAEVDPATAAAWTITNLNAAEFGVKVVT